MKFYQDTHMGIIHAIQGEAPTWELQHRVVSLSFWGTIQGKVVPTGVPQWYFDEYFEEISEETARQLDEAFVVQMLSQSVEV